MVSPISLDEIEKYAENVYEAIMVVAKRARQINDEQKQLLESQMDMHEDTEDNYDEEAVNHEAYDQPYVRLPKPTRLALEELLSGKLKCEYNEDTTPPDTEPEPEKPKKKK